MQKYVRKNKMEYYKHARILLIDVRHLCSRYFHLYFLHQKKKKQNPWNEKIFLIWQRDMKKLNLYTVKNSFIIFAVTL